MSKNWTDSSESQAIRDEILDLEKRLRHAEARLKDLEANETTALSSPNKILRSSGNIQGSMACILR